MAMHVSACDVGIETWEPAQGPNGEHVAIAGVQDGAGLVEDTLYILLQAEQKAAI